VLTPAPPPFALNAYWYAAISSASAIATLPSPAPSAHPPTTNAQLLTQPLLPVPSLHPLPQPVASFFSIDDVLLPMIVDEDNVTSAAAKNRTGGQTSLITGGQDVGDILSKINITDGIVSFRNVTNGTRANSATASSLSLGLAALAGLLLAALL
jgi:hypothetical protein